MRRLGNESSHNPETRAPPAWGLSAPPVRINTRPTARTQLPTASDRIGILYLEHTKIHTSANMLLVTTSEATLAIPTATLTALFRRPGTSITHSANKIAAEDAVTIVWTGADGARLSSPRTRGWICVITRL